MGWIERRVLLHVYGSIEYSNARNGIWLHKEIACDSDNFKCNIMYMKICGNSYVWQHVIILLSLYEVATALRWGMDKLEQFRELKLKLPIYLLNISLKYDANDSAYNKNWFKPMFIAYSCNTRSRKSQPMYSWLSHKKHHLVDELGAVSIRKTVLPGMAIPMLKIRRPNGRLIFNMEITIRR